MAQNNIYIIVGGLYLLVIGYDIFNWFRYRGLNSKEFEIKKLKSSINFLVFVTGITLTIFATCYRINFFNYSSPKGYDQINEFTLRDFKGLKTPGRTLHGNNEFAFIVTSIDLKVNQNQITIRSLFHPSRSYVYNEKLVDKSLLRHELYHFHITELFARKIRKELTEFRIQPSSKEIDEILNRLTTEKNAMQQDYDHDSYHSYVLKEQKKWENKIDSLLTLHKNYSTPTIAFPE